MKENLAFIHRKSDRCRPSRRDVADEGARGYRFRISARRRRTAEGIFTPSIHPPESDVFFRVHALERVFFFSSRSFFPFPRTRSRRCARARLFFYGPPVKTGSSFSLLLIARRSDGRVRSRRSLDIDVSCVINLRRGG